MTYIAKTKTFSLKTRNRLQFIDITKEVQDFIKSSKIKSGSVVIQTHHTTCGLWINEDEKNLIGPEKALGYASDMQRVLDRFANPSEKYNHDDICDINNPKGKRNTHLCEINPDGTVTECRNGYAHAQNLLIQSSISMIIEKSKLLLGTWQKVMLVELDHARERKYTILVQGEK